MHGGCARSSGPRLPCRELVFHAVERGSRDFKPVEREHYYSLSDLKEGLTYTWWHFLTVGMSTSSVLDQQRLVHFLGTVKQLGYLSPNNTETEGHHERLWVDLPFFEPAVLNMLRQAFGGHRDRVPCHGLQEWRNLNTLAARLSVSQVYDLKICAVIAMRDILEEQAVVTADMLEVVTMWLVTQGYWLEEMAAYSLVTRRHHDGQQWSVFLRNSVSVAPGGLAKEAGIDIDDVGPPRWRFWRSRLQALAADSTIYRQWHPQP